MATGTFVAYFRVSTSRQGVSGLGLDAQRETVRTFLNGGDWSLASEFVEVESGRSDARPELAKALARCRIMGATLIVANVSRLTRSVAFLSRLLESGVEVRFCDMPQIEGATGRFLLTQMVSVAELEAGMIGERTRKALAAAKARGTVLGGKRENSAAIHLTGAPASRALRGQDIERAQIYAKRLCAHLWVDSMRRRLQHSKGIHRTVVASPLVAEPAYRQRRDSVVRHLRKYCLGNTFQHEAVSIRDMAKDFG